MRFHSIWPSSDRAWNFNVSSLSILVGEEQELKYRLSQRSLLQCLVAAPAVGLQSYIRSYDLLLDVGTLNLTTPYGRASAPLKNKRLEHTIKIQKLLDDGRFTVYQIPAKSVRAAESRKRDPLLFIWVAFTWICFAGVVALALLAPAVTWIGIANVLCLTAWSITIRLVEYVYVKPSPLVPNAVTEPDRHDAIYILGRNNSAFVLKGSREDIKNWMAQGLIYDRKRPKMASLLQALTRGGSLLVLLFIFSTIPNGHTMDQLAFILSNALAQANVMIGQWLNSRYCLAELQRVESTYVATRTHVWGKLIQQFKELPSDWVEKVGLLPKTPLWEEWRVEYLKDMQKDPKALYDEVNDRRKARSGVAGVASADNGVADNGVANGDAVK